MKKIIIIICTLTLGGCKTHFQKELYSEVTTLREDLRCAEVEIKILEEKVENQTKMERTIQQMHNKLESTVASVSKTTESLSQHTTHIEQLDKKLEEIKKLRGVLTQLSKSTNEEKTYIVKQGDSLTKIARMHNTTVEALKTTNNLSTDQIFVGQPIQTP